MATAYQYDPTLARVLILDELFDLSLYKPKNGSLGCRKRALPI